MTTDPVSPASDVGAAVGALYPRVHALAVRTRLMLAGLAVLTFAGAFWGYQMMGDDPDAPQAVLVAVVIGVVAMSYAVVHMRRSQEALVIPVVANAVGLTYAKQDRGFFFRLPERLLPRGRMTKAEDVVTGRLGNHVIRMGEVVVETGGKRSRILFTGVVAQFSHRVPMPAFFLAPLEQTRSGLLFSAWISTDGLYHLRDITGPTGRTYGLWTPWTKLEEPPALSAVIEVLTQLETRIGAAASLFTAISDGAETYIALSHARDLFQAGGLFPRQEQLFADVSTATTELLIPLNLAHELIAAEALAIEKEKGA